LSYKDQKKASTTPLMELLMVRPRLSDAYLSDLTQIAAAGFDSPATSVVLVEKYPDLLEPACIEFLGSLNKSFRDGNKPLKLLKQFGTSKSLATLEALAKRMSSQSSAKHQLNLTLEAIEQIRSRESGN